MKKILALIFLVTLVSCSGTRNIYFNVQEPARVSVPPGVKSIALIDRTIAEDRERNLLEGIVTGEGTKQDKLATQIVIDGLNNRLIDRFDVKRTGEKLKGSGSGVAFPAQLSWEKIEELCNIHQSDAIISLETYDSDFIVTRGSIGEKGLEISAGGVAKIDCGFRFYYPGARIIIDEFKFTHQENWSTGGNTIEAAIGTVINKNAAIQEASYKAGLVYADRVIPSWYRVHREYFKKSKGNFDLEQGARMMESNDWDRAIEALERAVNTGHPKTKGRAAHNLAIVHEILGELETAKKWASDAWGLYGNKRSRDYGYILTRRINEQKRLEKQQSGY
jgi:hypothetical protein